MRPFAELGVIFLLFLIGLEFSLDRLWAMRRTVLGIGSVQVFLSMLLIGVTAAWFVGGVAVPLVVAMALALSSTAIASQVMIETRRFAAPVGRLCIGVLLFQDLMVVPIVIIVGLLGGDGVAIAGALMRAVGLAVVAVAVILTVGRFVVTPLMRLAAATGSRELVIAIALFLAIGTGLLTEMAGLSAALGAFLAGMLLGDGEFRHQIEVEIEPFKGLLLGLFFMTVGMSFNLASLQSNLLLLIAAVVALLVFKGVTIYGATRLFGIEPAVAAEAAFVLAGAGEFAFVVFTLARRAGVLTPDFYQFLLSVAALSMLATPAMAAVGRRIGGTARGAPAQRPPRRRSGQRGAHRPYRHRRLRPRRPGGRAPARCHRHRLCGARPQYRARGRRGQRGQAGLLWRCQPPRDPAPGRRRRGAGLRGDAGRAGRGRAHGAGDPHRLAGCRHLCPGARCRPRPRLIEAGATSVVPEALEGSLQLGGRVLAGIGLPDDAIDAYLAVQREAEIRRLTDHPPASAELRADRRAASAGPMRSTRLVQIKPSKCAGTSPSSATRVDAAGEAAVVIGAEEHHPRAVGRKALGQPVGEAPDEAGIVDRQHEQRVAARLARCRASPGARSG